MKKLLIVLGLTMLSIVVVMGGALLAGGRRADFQRGIMEDHYYYNTQAKLMFLMPTGWEGSVAETAEFARLFPYVNSNKDPVYVDFFAQNANTASVVGIAYFYKPHFMDIDKVAEEVTNLTVEEDKYEISFGYEETFDKTIGGKECRVEVLTAEYKGLTFREYCCYFAMGDYCGVIVIIPNPLITSPDSFDGICKDIIALE